MEEYASSDITLSNNMGFQLLQSNRQSHAVPHNAKLHMTPPRVVNTPITHMGTRRACTIAATNLPIRPFVIFDSH